MPMPKPMPGDGRPAHLLGQAVVATAAAEGVLGRLERVAGELERGAGVVVEAPHEPGGDLVGHADGVEPGLHRLEVRLAVGAEVLEELRRPFGHRHAAGDLAVEDPQRVGLDAAPAVLAQLVGVGPQVRRAALRGSRAGTGRRRGS